VEVIAKARGAGGGKLGDADVFAVGVVLGDLAMDADDARAVGRDFFGVVGWVIGATFIAGEPGSIDTQGHVLLGGGEAANDVGGEKDVAVAADEAVLHLIFRTEQRGQDVVVLPVGVFAECELRIIALDLVDLVAADEANVGEAIGFERIDGPIDEAAAGDFGVALGSVGRGGHEAAAAAGGDDNDFHFASCFSTRIMRDVIVVNP